MAWRAQHPEGVAAPSATAVYLAAVPAGSFIAAADLPGSPRAAARAVAGGELVRVRRGLYFKGVRTRYGMTAPGPVEVAVRVLGPGGVGPAGHCAARAFGLTTQVPARPELAVTRAQLPTIAGVVLRRRGNAARRDLGSDDVALLEVLRDFEHLSEKPLWALAAAVTASSIDLRRIDLALRTDRSPAARRQFDALLQECATLPGGVRVAAIRRLECRVAP